MQRPTNIPFGLNLGTSSFFEEFIKNSIIISYVPNKKHIKWMLITIKNKKSHVCDKKLIRGSISNLYMLAQSQVTSV